MVKCSVWLLLIVNSWPVNRVSPMWDISALGWFPAAGTAWSRATSASPQMNQIYSGRGALRAGKENYVLQLPWVMPLSSVLVFVLHREDRCHKCSSWRKVCSSPAQRPQQRCTIWGIKSQVFGGEWENHQSQSILPWLTDTEQTE